MWKSLCGSLGVLLIVSLIASAHFYRAAKKARAELSGIELALEKKKSDILQDTLNAVREASLEKDTRQHAVHEAGTEAAVQIATAKIDAPSALDPDGFLPLSLTEPLHELHDKICAGGACGYPEPGILRAEAHAGANVAGRTKGDAPAGGRR